MPKIGMEPIRRKALIDATIAEVGAAGSLDVTVGQIAKRAGMSSALAHHYFGGKDQILLAAMRHILLSFGARARQDMAKSRTPLERLHAIVAVSFDEHNFDKEVVAAWLTFYLQAQTSTEARRLLTIYTARLHANLVFALKQLTDASAAHRIAQGVGAMIDGFYIRNALMENAPSRHETVALVNEYIDLHLNHANIRGEK